RRAAHSSTPPTRTATAGPSGPWRRGSPRTRAGGWLRPKGGSPSPPPLPGGRRGEPAPVGHRRYRPVPGTRTRSGGADRGHARRARRLGPRRQGPDAGRVQLSVLATRLVGGGPGPRGLGAVRQPATSVLAGRTLRRTRPAAVLPGRRARRAAVGSARRRLPPRPGPAWPHAGRAGTR